MTTTYNLVEKAFDRFCDENDIIISFWDQTYYEVLKSWLKDEYECDYDFLEGDQTPKWNNENKRTEFYLRYI